MTIEEREARSRERGEPVSGEQTVAPADADALALGPLSREAPTWVNTLAASRDELADRSPGAASGSGFRAPAAAAVFAPRPPGSAVGAASRPPGSAVGAASRPPGSADGVASRPPGSTDGVAGHAPDSADDAADGLPAPASSLRVGAAFKHYELLRSLGQGGMGAVYLARDTKLGRLVALKTLLDPSGPNAARFLAEARATARCKHENIVVIHEVDEIEGRPYMALEYLEGRTLRDWLAQRAPAGARPRAAAGPVADGGPTRVEANLYGEHGTEVAVRGPGADGGASFAGARGRAAPLDRDADAPAGAAPAGGDGIASGGSAADGGAGLVEGLAPSDAPASGEGPASVGGVAADLEPARVPPALAIELMLPVVRALACAHRQGVVHRDLKPANIFLTDAGPVKVLDFGIAKRLGAVELSAYAAARVPHPPGAELTGPGELVGTLSYMAPEQWAGGDVDARADVWAVGMLLYRLVVGEHPLGSPPSLQRVAQVAKFDRAMPSAAAACAHAPELAAVIDRCLRKRRDERFASADELAEALERVRLGGAGAGPAAGDEAAPFAGLSAFQEADAGRFFGREREAAAVLNRLRSQPLVAVVGPSGAGKSSFVRAGVVPAFKRAHERAEAHVLRPGRRPLGALAELLASAAAERGGVARADRGGAEGLAARLRAQPGLFGARLRARCRRRGGPRHLLVFVDQFEELYTLGAGPDERDAFLACLEGAADDASSPLRVVISVRSDFLDRLAEARLAGAEIARGLVLLPPMGPRGLRDALLRPLEAAGHRFEGDDVPAAMLDALGRTRCPLPLLQFTAARLWERRDRARKLLTRRSYDELGGVAGALSAHADAVLEALPAGEQALARAVLRRLVTPERTRAVVGLGELRALAPDGAAALQVVGRLSDARLLLVEPGGAGVEGGEGSTVELVHESLIERWAKLRRWLDEDEEDAQFLHRLRAAARQWRAGGEAEGLVWRDRAADEARAWWARRRAEPAAAAAGRDVGAGEARFLAAVVALAERSRRRRRAAAAGLVVALVAVAAVVSTLALRSNRAAARALAEASRADRSAALAEREASAARNASRMATARELQRSDPTTALALLREVEPPSPPRGWADLAFHVLHGGVSLAVIAHPDAVRSAAFSPDGARVVTASSDHFARVYRADGSGEPVVLRGHEGSVMAAAFSPDGRRVVTASVDKTARVWNADGSGEPVVLRGHGAPVLAAAFSPDGARVVTASQDATARVWRADGAGEPVALRGHGEAVQGASFSPDGARVVTASWDGTARVWNADGSGEPLALRGHAQWVMGASFSPDGRRIVTASRDATARVWAAPAAGKPAGPPLTLRGHGGPVLAASFSPDGERIVTASADKAARVFRADGAGEPVVLRGHEETVNSASFGPDGRSVVTASGDKTVRVWRADGGGAPVVLRGHGGELFAAGVSADGRRVVTASDDQTARVWSADGGGVPVVLRGHAGNVQAASFSPDGRRVVTASSDRTARVWPADGAGEPVVLRGHDADVSSAAFSPDGERVVTASSDRSARVWRADGGGAVAVLRGHEGGLFTAAFSPDGRRVVTTAQDKTVRVWPADGGGEPVVLRGHATWAVHASFSPDGARVVTASWDGTARVWNADGSGEPVVLRGHDGRVVWAAFSPDGTRVVTASRDKTARVWPADGAGEPVVLRGHDKWVLSAAFSPDGERVVTASSDHTARVWDAGGAGEPLALLGHEATVNGASFGPDGAAVVTASADHTARVWRALRPLRGLDDPRLWAASSYCPAAARRAELLHLSEHAAGADEAACRRRVAEAHAAAR